MNLMASRRVETSSRNTPWTAEVTVTAPGFWTPPHGHAQVLGFNNHQGALGFQGALDSAGHLGGQALLDLQASGEAVYKAGQLGEAGNHAAFLRDVGHVGHAEERQ